MSIYLVNELSSNMIWLLNETDSNILMCLWEACEYEPPLKFLYVYIYENVLIDLKLDYESL